MSSTDSDDEADFLSAATPQTSTEATTPSSSVMTVPKRRKRAQTSATWTHFSIDKSTGLRKCLHCTATFSKSTSTSTLYSHVSVAHAESTQKSSELQQARLESMAPYALGSGQQAQIEKALALMVVHKNLPFSVFEGKFAKNAIRALNMRARAPTASTITEVINNVLFPEAVAAIESHLERASSIALTTDTWCSKTMQHFLSVTAHFVVDNGTQFSLISKVIAVSPFHHRSTGEDLKTTISSICTKFGIASKVLCVVADNASNMTNMVQKMRSDPIFAHLQYRHGCCAHWLNLIIQAFFKHALPTALTKLRTVIKKISKSAVLKSRLGAFQAMHLPADAPAEQSERCKSNPSVPPIDVVTRWSSTFLMISGCLRVQESVHLLTQTMPGLSLTTGDWQTLELLKHILAPYDNITKILGYERQVSISLVLVSFKAALNSLEAVAHAAHVSLAGIQDAMISDQDVPLEDSTIHSDGEGSDQDDSDERETSFAESIPSEVHPLLRELWARTNSRFQALKQLVHLQCASILDPRFKSLMYLEQSEREAFYVSLATFLTQNAGLIQPPQPPLVQPSSTPSACGLDFLRSTVGPTESQGLSVTQELSAYRSEPQAELHMSPLDWWNTRRLQYPCLAKAACHILAIPATSTPSERVFSHSGNIVTNRRRRVGGQVIEKSILIRSGHPESQDTTGFFSVDISQ